jgi:ABC-2 type transport system ATP-binding protein
MTRALDQVSLAVPAGHILVLLGPNGSGKTTALKLISTTLLPDAGRVLIQGIDSKADENEVRRRVGFCIASERSFFPRLSAYENLDFFATMDDVPRSQRAAGVGNVLEQVGLTEACGKQVMRFSSGMYQRLAIARALCKQPSILLLDEPTRSLDPASATHLWSLVRELSSRGTTIMVASHNFDEATQVGDAVVVLQNGRIAGQQSLAGMNARSLRSFYSHCTGEVDELAEIEEAVG